MSEAVASAEESGIEPDGLDTPQIIIWAFVSVVIVLSVMFGAAALFFSVQNQFNAEMIVAPKYSASEEIIHQQQGLLTGYRAPTAEGEPYYIPIEEAKTLVLRELQTEAKSE